MKIAGGSITRRSIIIIWLILLTIGAIFSNTQLRCHHIPKLENTVSTRQAIYPGAAPSEVENSVTKKIEDAISSLENIKKIESKSLESVSVVMITLNSGADVNYLMTDAQRRINAIENDLP